MSGELRRRVSERGRREERGLACSVWFGEVG